MTLYEVNSCMKYQYVRNYQTLPRIQNTTLENFTFNTNLDLHQV